MASRATSHLWSSPSVYTRFAAAGCLTMVPATSMSSGTPVPTRLVPTPPVRVVQSYGLNQSSSTAGVAGLKTIRYSYPILTPSDAIIENFLPRFARYCTVAGAHALPAESSDAVKLV